jgi:NDP-sugar pyrophosphorylase family protein
MLVAAGFGSRLDPLTRELPKPAVPVGNRPLAWFALDHLRRQGVRELVANTHHLASELRGALEPLVPGDVSLRFVHEAEILGTGGGVRNAWQPVDGEDFVVMNAKLLFSPDLRRALQLHRDAGAIATMVLRPQPPGGGFAPVEVDGEGRIRRLRGLPDEVPAQGLLPRMYTGVQILSARAHRDLPEAGDIIEHAYLPWVARGETVMGIVDEAPWIDAGVSVGHYLEANLALARGELTWPGIAPGPNGTIVASDAQLQGARLRDCVVGAGAEVPPGTALREVVVWPGAQVPEGALVVERAVVTTAGRVVKPSAP